MSIGTNQFGSYWLPCKHLTYKCFSWIQVLLGEKHLALEISLTHLTIYLMECGYTISNRIGRHSHNGRVDFIRRIRDSHSVKLSINLLCGNLLGKVG